MLLSASVGIEGDPDVEQAVVCREVPVEGGAPMEADDPSLGDWVIMHGGPLKRGERAPLTIPESRRKR